MVVLPTAQKPTQRTNENEGNPFQIKENKKSETDINGKKISDLADRDQNDGHKDVNWNEVHNVWTSEDFNREVENIKKYQTKTTEMKNTVEGFKIRLDEVEERMGESEDRA